MNKKSEIAFVIATKDRPEDLKKLLKSLVNQTLLPARVIVVDGGEKAVKNLVQAFPRLNIKYIRFLPPSGTRQRNAGVKAVDKNIPLIGFLDDDAVLEKNSIKKMGDFWHKTEKDIGGASFNMLNHPTLYAANLKSSPFTKKLHLYSNKNGKVTKSGFQTMIGTKSKLTYTDWLPSGASVWRREVLEKYHFDEWFGGYSYLEDLDFSYQVRKEWRLAVVPNAGYYHFPALSNRGNGFCFGKREVINRLYFVKKHKELSVTHCITGITIRIFISAVYIFKEKEPKYYMGRILGIIAGFLEAF